VRLNLIYAILNTKTYCNTVSGLGSFSRYWIFNWNRTRYDHRCIEKGWKVKNLWKKTNHV